MLDSVPPDHAMLPRGSGREGLVLTVGSQQDYSRQTDVPIAAIPLQRVRTPAGEALLFPIDAFRKRCLIESLDDIAYALTHAG